MLLTPTQDDAASILALESGSASLALVRADVLYDAVQGEGTWKVPIRTKLTVVAQLYVHALTAVARRQGGTDARQLSVLPDSDWTSVAEELERMRERSGNTQSETRPDLAAQEVRRQRMMNITDLEGVRTSLKWDRQPGPRGNAVTLFEPVRFLHVLWKSSLRSEEPFPEAGARLFNEGRVDGMICALAHPSPWLKARLRWENATLLPITGLERELSETPYLVQTTLRRDWYEGVEGTVSTLGVPVLLVAREGADPEMVLELVNLLLDERETLVQVAPQLGGATLRVLHSSTFLPFHPVAEGRYRQRERREVERSRKEGH